MTGQTVAYVRVSSVDQNPERQHETLAGANKVFEDKVSGKNADRPALRELLEYVREGDTVRIASMDRLARNVDDLRRIVADLTARGVRVEFVKEALTFTGDDSPMSKLLLTLLGGIAEFERSLIRERQAEGIALAKKNGVYKGRAKALTAEQVEEARERVESGVAVARIARDLGVSRQTLYAALWPEGRPVVTASGKVVGRTPVGV